MSNEYPRPAMSKPVTMTATEDPREFLLALRETIAYETDEVEAESLIVTPDSDFHHYLVGQVSAHRETLYRLDAYLARTMREA